MTELLDEVREAAEPLAWTRGVELARAGAVFTSVEATEDDLELVVAPPAPARARTVHLDPEGLDWGCSCDGDDPCAHVAAAVIAWNRARKEGVALPPREVPTERRIAYRFTSSGQGLSLGRVLVDPDGSETPLRYSVGALIRGRDEGPPVAVGRVDRDAERLLGTRLSGIQPRRVLAKLLDVLARASDVQLDGEKVRCSGGGKGVVGTLSERGRGFILTIEQDPSIEAVFPGGVVRCGDTLHPVVDPDLSAEEIARLRRGETFEADEADRLVAEVLPDLEARIPVNIKTRRLPGRSSARPRLRVDADRRDDGFDVLVTLVYGDPPVARVDAGRLVSLSDDAVPIRDEAAERRLAARVSGALGLEVGVVTSVTGDAARALSDRLDDWDAELDGTASGTAFDQLAPAPELLAHLSVTGRLLDLSFETGEGGRADPDAVLAAWKSGASVVPLTDGGLAPIPMAFLAEHGERLLDLLSARGEKDEVPPAAVPDLAALCADLDLPPPPGMEDLAALLEDDGTLPEPALPEDLNAELRPYQLDGVRWLSFLREAGLGGLLADDMGLGKTLQSLCVARGRTLVVAPTSVLVNWKQEAERFRPGLSVALYHGPDRELDPDADLTVTTWGILRIDAEALSTVVWDTIILDEAQAIKNPGSQTAQAAYRLQGDFRLALTGTPVENRLEELWSALRFAAPGLLGNLESFKARYVKPIAEGQPGAAARLRARIRPFVLRRLKSEVATDLPARTDVVLRCELSDEEQAVYQAVQLATREQVVAALGAGGGGVMKALEALLRLRQAACHPALVPGHAEGAPARSAKIELLMETLEEILAEDHKALVFSQWTSLLDLVEPVLEAAGVAFTRLDGSTRDRAGVVETFQADGGPPVMLVSLKAGGTGLNLTAADHIFLLDPWWNPAVEDQAAGRAHRIGQERPVLVHRLVAEDTVDERILALQDDKRALAEAALGEGDAAAALTRDDLLALLAG